MAKNYGKNLEMDLKTSAKEQGIFFYRIKDVNPMFLKPKASVSKNDYDSFIYRKPNLFPTEFKSTAQKSISFDEKIIKSHQIKALTNAATYEGLIAGFIFNFREYSNQTYFVHIEDFNKIKYIADNGITDHTYESKINKSSIGLDTCREVGVEIKNVKKKVKYRYYIGQMLDELAEKYGDKD